MFNLYVLTDTCFMAIHSFWLTIVRNKAAVDVSCQKVVTTVQPISITTLPIIITCCPCLSKTLANHRETNNEKKDNFHANRLLVQV